MMAAKIRSSGLSTSAVAAMAEEYPPAKKTTKTNADHATNGKPAGIRVDGKQARLNENQDIQHLIMTLPNVCKSSGSKARF